MLTLGVGVGVLITSLILTYVISSKADMLFSAGREPTNATYWSTRRLHRPTTTTTTTTITTTTTTSIPNRQGQALFSLNHTRRYRLDTAAEGGGVFWWRLHVYGLTEVRRDMRTRPDWIGLDGSGLIRVRKHWSGTSGPCQWKDVYIHFCFPFFFFYCKKKKEERMFLFTVSWDRH